ncbi:MAG: putative transporter [Methyloprofundus sp.]|nr:putative transporter [Methyloprofundus sp.]
MNWLYQLVTEPSVPHSLLIISLIISIGLAFGQIPFFNIRLGIAGVLFSGLAFGHFNITIDPHIMHFLREFGLILFVYAIGLQVGPGFVNSFLHSGIQLNIMAASIVLLGALITVTIIYFGGIDIAVAVGLFSGATTNTPALAAAQEVLAQTPNIDTETLKMPGLGYAVAYPFGIIGIILSMLLIKRLFNINISTEAAAFLKFQQQNTQRPIWKDLTIENPNINGLRIAEIPFFDAMNVIVTRILHNGMVNLVTNNTQFSLGDSIRLVGSHSDLNKIKILIGPDSEQELNSFSDTLHSKRIIVTNKEVIGKSVGELHTFYSVIISRIHRPEIEFVPHNATRVHFGDELYVVASEEALEKITTVLGNSVEALNHPQIIPIFIGITLGIILGSWPFFFPGIPSAIKLGLAGGPLIVAILLSQMPSWGTMSSHLPKSSSIILKDIGIVLFLACVGLYSGDHFVSTLINGDGFYVTVN